MLDGNGRERGQTVLEKFPTAAVEAYHIDNVIHAVHPNAFSLQLELLTKVAVEEKPSLPEVPLPLGKLLFEADHAVLEDIKAFLTEQGWSGDYELIFSGKSLLEMTARGANKGGIVRRLAARLGLSMEHVYCVGDEANDIPMLTAATECYAPANCVPIVRDCGATIVADARESALADVIRLLGVNYPG